MPEDPRPDIPLSPPSNIPSPSPPDSLLEADTPCITCGYNLQGRAPSGLCPECGTPIPYSLHGDSLSVSDPQWVRRLNLGVTLMLVNVLVSFLLGFVTLGVGREIGFALSLLGQGLALAAMWLITEPEPRAWRAEENLTLRKSLRILSIVNLVASIFTVSGEMASNSFITIVGSALAIIGLAAFWLLYLHLSRLSLRLPDEQLARQFRIVMWGYTISAGVMLLGGLLALLVVGRTASPTAGFGIAIFLIFCPAAIGLISFSIWSLVLLFRIRSRLSTAAILARTFRDSLPLPKDPASALPLIPPTP